jgi:hypothetical protein
MKLYIIFLLCCFSVFVTFGQEASVDSLANPVENGITDPLLVKADSIQSDFYQNADSLKHAYQVKLAKLDSPEAILSNKLKALTALPASIETILSGNTMDSLSSGFKNKTDSLHALQQRTAKISHALDSVQNLRDSTLADLNLKLQTLKNKTVGRLKSLDLPPHVADKVTDITSNIEGFKIPVSDLNGSSIGNISGMDKLPNLNMQSPIQNLTNADELKAIDGGLGELPDVKDIGGYTDDLKQLKKGNLEGVDNLPQAAESKMEEVSGVSEVTDQTKVLDEYKGKAEQLQNPDSIKQLAIQEVKQVAVNHFAGKEQQLKEAMETMSKYKSKYSSINSLSDIGKRRPNEMRGKPLIERILPGVGIQLQKRGEDLLVDFNPYFGYRFTGRITAGLGWNQRVAYTIDQRNFNPDARIYGPRTFGEFKLWRGFSPRIELEVMNTNVPPVTRTATVDPQHREWVWGGFAGLKKEYKLIKNVKGTAMVMIRLFNPDRKSPYADVVNARFGFEFPIKKKVKPNS